MKDERGSQATEMEVRVARAMFLAYATKQNPPWPGGDVPEPFIRCRIETARAAIRAMREPTREMLEAGDRKISMGSQYQAMIDAATARSQERAD